MTPETTQILFVDLQPEIVGNSKTNSPEKLIQSAVALARIGKLFGLPMLASVVPVGSGDSCFAPELAAELNGVRSIQHTMVSAFDDLPTAAAIQDVNRHDLVICGVITEAAVLLTCRGAILRGHGVHVPVDACGGGDTADRGGGLPPNGGLRRKHCGHHHTRRGAGPGPRGSEGRRTYENPSAAHELSRAQRSARGGLETAS